MPLLATVPVGTPHADGYAADRVADEDKQVEHVYKSFLSIDPNRGVTVVVVGGVALMERS
jgi:hypothetical protein